MKSLDDFLRLFPQELVDSHVGSGYGGASWVPLALSNRAHKTRKTLAILSERRGDTVWLQFVVPLYQSVWRCEQSLRWGYSCLTSLILYADNSVNLMAEIKLILTDTTSVSDIANFFQGLDDTQQVRARQTKEGVIELYVRGSSKWHLLTDNLRFGFLVTRDYQAAKEKIEDIFKGNRIINSLKAPKDNLSKSISTHQHDFYVKEVKNDLQIAEKVLTRQEISKGNVKNFFENTLVKLYEEKNLEDIASYLADKFNTTPSPASEFIKIIKLAELTLNPVKHQSLELTEIDFEQVENFSIEWQKSIAQKNARPKDSEEISPEKIESKAELRLADKAVAKNFIGKITAAICEKIPIARVNISQETINYSSADLIIFDPSSGYDNYSMLEKEVSDLSPKITNNDDDNMPPFIVTSYSHVKTTSEQPGIDAFKITYMGLDYLMSNERKINDLYTALGKMIEDKLKSLKHNDNFTIHLPILNPIEKEKLTPDEAALNLNAFVEHTSKWLLKFPNLRIQIQLPRNTEKEAVIEAYQLARNQNHASQPAD